MLDTLLRRRSNTDIVYMRDMLPRVSEHVPVSFSFNQSVLEALKVDSARLTKRLRRARGTRTDLKSADDYPRYRIPTRVAADVVYAYGCGVAGRVSAPIVYHDVFAPFWLEADANGKVIRYKHGAIEQAAVITTWTEHSATVCRERFPQHAGKIRVVPPYLPRLSECFLPPQEKWPTRAAADAVNFVFVGTEAKRKGLESVVAAWERLPPGIRQRARLTVCSALADGEVRIPPDVELRGYEPNVPALLRRSDVLLMPSRQESYGFVYAEAAAAGCAIVATDDATRRSMLPAGGTSFVAPTDASQIADAIRRHVEDRTYLRTAQELQYAHALQTWSSRHVAERHYEAFEAARTAGA